MEEQKPETVPLSSEATQEPQQNETAEEEKNAIDQQYVRKKVKKNIMKRNKPKPKVNTSKNRVKAEARDTAKNW